MVSDASDPESSRGVTTYPALLWVPSIGALVATPTRQDGRFRAFSGGAWRALPLSDEDVSCLERPDGGVMSPPELGEGVATVYDPVTEGLVLHGGVVHDVLPHGSERSCLLRRR